MTCESLGEPVLPSAIVNTVEEAKQAAENIGYPVVLRPAFTLGGTGGGLCNVFQSQRLHVHFICNGGICHNRRRIGVA